jgi:DNA-binding GntR family transcriptional regulator
MNLLQPVAINEAVYRALRDQLMRGDFAAGQCLGIEEIALAMNTSTMPVRAALNRLAEQRVLERNKSRSMQVPLLTLERLEDIRRSRLLLEGALTAWATPRLNPSDLDLLKDLARKIARALKTPSTIDQGLVHNQAFHFTIYQAASSPTLLSMVESLWLQSGPYLRASRELMHRAQGPDLALHDRILQALVDRDAPAAQVAIEQDIAWAFDRLRAVPDKLSIAA